MANLIRWSTIDIIYFTRTVITHQEKKQAIALVFAVKNKIPSLHTFH